MSNTSNPVFSPSCPAGGDYYACGNGAHFVGCCASDPCNAAGCPSGNLRAMSFDPAYHGSPEMPDQQCAVAGQQWWSCAATDPPFMGCCSINPCTSGCPQANLIQGTLSSVASIANAYDPQPPLSSSDNSTNTDTTTTADNSSSGVSTGVIVGAVVGGCAALAITALLVWCLRRRSRKRAGGNSALGGGIFARFHGDQSEKANHYQDAPSMPIHSPQQGTPLPAYGFHPSQPQPQSPPPPSHYYSYPQQQQQQQEYLVEADSSNQVPAYSSPTPGSPPNRNHQRYSSTHSTSAYSNTTHSHGYAPQPPSELGDNNTNNDNSHSHSHSQSYSDNGRRNLRAPLHGLGVGIQHIPTATVQSPVELGTNDRDR